MNGTSGLNAKLRRRSVLSGTIAGAASLVLPRIAWADDSTIKIALVAPFSGFAQVVGKELQIGAQVALDQVNRAGGVQGRKLELVMQDDHGDPSFAVAGARELAGKGVTLLMGTPIASCAMAVEPILPGLSAIMIGTGSAEERLTHELYNRNFFTASENAYTRLKVAARFVAEHYPEANDWIAILPDNAMGNDASSRFSKNLQVDYPAIAKKQVTILDPVLTKIGATDFKNQLGTLMQSKATGLISFLFGGDGITFFQQAHAFGLDKKFKAIIEYGLEMDLPKALKHNMPSDVWSLSYYCFKAFPDNPEGQELQRVYAKETGDPIPHGLAGLAHIAVKSYTEAIRTAGSTATPNVIEALETIRLNTIRGPASFRKEDHQMIATTCMVNFGPADSQNGWDVKKVYSYRDENDVNPPTPGAALKL